MSDGPLYLFLAFRHCCLFVVCWYSCCCCCLHCVDFYCFDCENAAVTLKGRVGGRFLLVTTSPSTANFCFLGGFFGFFCSVFWACWQKLDIGVLYKSVDVGTARKSQPAKQTNKLRRPKLLVKQFPDKHITCTSVTIRATTSSGVCHWPIFRHPCSSLHVCSRLTP